MESQHAFGGHKNHLKIDPDLDTLIGGAAAWPLMARAAARVAGLWDPTTGKAQATISESAAHSLNLNLQILEVRNRDALAGAFLAARDGRAAALSVFASSVLASLNREIIDLSAEYRLPAIYQWREAVEAGGLLSYGPVGVDVAAVWGDRNQGPQGCKTNRLAHRAADEV